MLLVHSFVANILDVGWKIFGSCKNKYMSGTDCSGWWSVCGTATGRCCSRAAPSSPTRTAGGSWWGPGGSSSSSRSVPPAMMIMMMMMMIIMIITGHLVLWQSCRLPHLPSGLTLELLSYSICRFSFPPFSSEILVLFSKTNNKQALCQCHVFAFSFKIWHILRLSSPPTTCTRWWRSSTSTSGASWGTPS